MSRSDPRIRHVEQCVSTNDLAHKLTGSDGVTAVMADEQTAGRGRLGRAWISEPNQGLYLSWLCKPDFAAAQGGTLPLLVAVATYDLCISLGFEASLKWPNDILVSNAKLAGILCEARVQGDQWHAVVGIGLNLKAPKSGWPKDLVATSLSEHVSNPPTRTEIATDLLDRLEQLLDLANANGTAWIVEQWMERGPTIETEMKCQGYTGKYLGLTSDGSIRLYVSDCEMVFSAGDVEHV